MEVYAYDHDGPTTALLLERCRPGDQLRSRPEHEPHEVIIDLLHRLWRVPLPQSHRFRPLSEMCDAWADESAAARARTPVP